MVSAAMQSRALKIMKKLCSRPLAQIFLQKPSGSSDAEVFNLATVQNKLSENSYRSISDWKSDVHRVFDTAIAQEKNLNLVNASTELKNYFEEITKDLRETIEETWKTKLGFLHTELTTYVRELLKCRPGSSQKPRAIVKRDQLTPIIEELPPPHLRRHFTPLSEEELSELMKHLNGIKEKKLIQKVFSILKENEAALLENSKAKQLDLSLFKPETLQALKEIFDDLKET